MIRLWSYAGWLQWYLTPLRQHVSSPDNHGDVVRKKMSKVTDIIMCEPATTKDGKKQTQRWCEMMKNEVGVFTVPADSEASLQERFGA